MSDDNLNNTTDLSGQTIGHYKIESRLGEGGMGVVYKAHDTRLNRPVAIKVLHETLAGQPAYQKLLDEARAASALNNPHICTIYEVGEAEGQSYITMEYVDGISLRELLPADGFPVETAIRYGLQIAEGLAHAHEQRIIHRDLKSANIMVTKDGRAKILDFGLAEQMPVEEAEAITKSREAVSSAAHFGGTIHYMAPELLKGNKADQRSDIWALGVVLYEMLTGKMPFQGKTGFELATAILREQALAMPTSLPVSLRSIIMRCLSKDPSQRYQHAAEVRAVLEAVQSESIEKITMKPIVRLTARWKRLIVAGIIIIVAYIGWQSWVSLRPWLGRKHTIRSIAVLPLANLSGDPSQEYFVEGMTDELITVLSKIGTIRVISRTSAMRYKDTDKSLPEIGRELNVDGVIEGSVLKSDSTVRINAQLIHAPTDTHLWAKSYERTLDNIVELQGEVAREIAKEIEVTLTQDEEANLVHHRKVDPEAYQLYLMGRFHWNKRTPESLQKGIEYFKQAIEKDPGCALAYSGLADSYSLLGYYNLMRPHEAYPKSNEAALKALQLDSRLAEAHAILAVNSYIYSRDWDTAEQEFKVALELNPNYATGRQWYAAYLAATLRLSECLKEIELARKLDPLSLVINADIGLHLYDMRRYDDAIKQLQKTLELEPNFVLTHAVLSMVYIRKSRFQEAISELQEVIRLAGNKPEDVPDAMGILGYAYAVSGREDDARKTLDSLREISERKYVSPFSIALVYAGLSDKDSAFAWLQKAIDERSSYIIRIAVDPLWENLRTDPRFKELLHQIGLEAYISKYLNEYLKKEDQQ